MCMTRLRCHFGFHPKDNVILKDAIRLSESRFRYSGTCQLCGRSTTTTRGFPKNLFSTPDNPLTFGDVI